MSYTLSMPYSLSALVNKVCFYTKTEGDKKRSIELMVKLAEESRIKLYEEEFNLSKNLMSLKHQLNDKCWSLFFNGEISKITSNIETYNRCIDYLVVELKAILKPVWGVYFGESCSGIHTMIAWVEKAEKDNGEKVFSKLNEFKE